MSADGGPVRELSFEERCRWGTCPACSAPHGTACRASVGIQLGTRVDGRKLQDGEGAHLGRLNRAPLRVREVPA